ncbi:specifically androgen-regulated gene protein [Nothoprocta perdicaria]|uniref:specifically androgen-regulated gene protein n=1 Tax=Nothoprocta perdicaria TaxID=30464 RepID=UPI000E1C1CF0|nr:specifically androgen-regulated gene protein [Nothoprocta perdicaria]
MAAATGGVTKRGPWLGRAGCSPGSRESAASAAPLRAERSDSGYDCLSVEEKECLKFLEETIGSLDTDVDSGTSLDETDPVEPARPPRSRRESAPHGLENGAVSPSGAPQGPAEQSNGQDDRGTRSSAPSPACCPPAGSVAAAEAPRAAAASNGTAGHPLPAPARETGREEGASATARAPGPTSVPPPAAPQEARGQEQKPAAEEDTDAKRGPPTAPKPRKLPPNIVLKSSRNGPVPPGPALERASPARPEPQERDRARREALEKLGLPQDKKKPGSPPKAAAAPKPGAAPGAADSPERLPPRVIGFKSNTLERSGVGLGSRVGGKDASAKSGGSLGKMSFMERITPGFLRSSRPRPASLGTGSDLAGLRAELEQSGQRRAQALPARAPRAAGVSVRIAPAGTAGEHRREALRKLGLLKD